MANQEQVELLLRGKDIWSEWREQHPEVNIDLSGADLFRAKLGEANLGGADLSGANLSEANLSGANLTIAILVGTNLTGATLTHCSIYGISVWNAQLDGAKQENIVISDDDEPVITVDNLEVAQFIYLLLN